MNKKIILALIISTLTFITIGCQNTISDLDTDIVTEKVIDEDNSKEIMLEFELIKESGLTEVVNFIDANIDNVKKVDADAFLLYFIERSKEDLLSANADSIDAKLKTIFGINFGPHAVEDGIEYGVTLVGDKKEIALSNLSENAEIDFIKGVFLKGQTTNQYEGEYFLIIDYNYLNDKYSDKVSDSLSEYLAIMSTETITPLISGEYLAVPLDELKNRVIRYEKFLVNTKDTSYKTNIEDLYSVGLWRILSTFTYFNDFTDDYKLKGGRLDYYKELIKLESTPIMKSSVEELYEFFNSETNGLKEVNAEVDAIIYAKEKEIHSKAMNNIIDK